MASNPPISRSAPVRGMLRQLPTTRKLQLIVLVFVCIFFLVLALVYLGAQITSAARAYVGGEGLWSKAQKKAALELHDYALTHNEKDYQEFLRSLSVPLGDRQARLEMEKSHPDEQVMLAGFRQGKIPDGDIPGLIMLFRRFRKTQLIETAASIWEKGDYYIDEMRQEGTDLHTLIQSGHADADQIAAIERRIEETDGNLTPLEDQFSLALSDGARGIERLLMVGLPLAACLLLAFGLAISVTVAREIESSEAERDRAEIATRRSELRYRELLENANDVIYVHDVSGNFISWNRRGEELLGYNMSASPNLHIRDVIAPQDLPLAQEMTARKLAGKSAPPYSLTLVSKDGRLLQFEVSSRLLFEGDRPMGVQGIARDVTERHRLENELLQSQKMEAVGRLAGGIAHDFNNILMIVRGYTEMLLEKLHREDPLHAHASQILKAGNRAAELTQRLLGFSRKQVFAPKVLRINDLVSEISKMLPRLLGAHIDFTLELGANAGQVSVDPIQLEQVVMNLAVNARDAMPQGGKLIITTAAQELDGRAMNGQTSLLPGRYAEIRVQDSGCGIDDKDLGHIFEPFFTTKDKDKGTGLGLSTVYGIVKRSGGYVFVESAKGLGTSMSIYLPQVLGEALADPAEAPTPVTAQSGGTILIAEDEDALRELISGRLRAEGYEVLEAADGQEALSIARSRSAAIDVLLTDVIMPRLRGPELAAELRYLYPALKVIFMSGYTESALIQDGMLERETVLLQKPFTIKKVLAALQQASIGLPR